MTIKKKKKLISKSKNFKYINTYYKAILKKTCDFSLYNINQGI